MRTKLLATVVAMGMGLSAGFANATTLTIVNPQQTAGPEVTGDAGGTSYPFVNGSGVSGPGIPSSAAGWPNGPGFAADPSFGGALGTSGWHGAYLTISDLSAPVLFQYMGKGNSELPNSFQVFYHGTWTTLFNAQTPACGAGPGTTPICTPGVNEFALTFASTDFFAGNYVPFMYRTGNGVTPTNDGTGGNPDTALGTQPGFFLGVDPYIASCAGQGPLPPASCGAVYAGLTDLPASGDHDFQDLGVRISVPEPATLALLGSGLLGLGLMRRRRAA